jgi:uncharacterized protein YigE (DUF2233 family)
VNKNSIFILITIFILSTVGLIVFAQKQKSADDRFVSYIVDIKKQEIKLYWKNEQQENFKSIQNLKNWLDKHHKLLVFAMNAGMYKQNNAPQGLFIENQKTITPLDTTSGNGNFYLKPNGVFYCTVDSFPMICTTTNFMDNGNIKYATQSGPMLVIDGQIHSAFKGNSTNLNIRNGVGILPDNKIIFAMSKRKSIFMTLQTTLKKWVAKTRCISMGLFHVHIYPNKIGHKQTATLAL